jgi:hypothetical protein
MLQVKKRQLEALQARVDALEEGVREAIRWAEAAEGLTGNRGYEYGLAETANRLSALLSNHEGEGIRMDDEWADRIQELDRREREARDLIEEPIAGDKTCNVFCDNCGGTGIKPNGQKCFCVR